MKKRLLGSRGPSARDEAAVTATSEKAAKARKDRREGMVRVLVSVVRPQPPPCAFLIAQQHCDASAQPVSQRRVACVATLHPPLRARARVSIDRGFGGRQRGFSAREPPIV